VTTSTWPVRRSSRPSKDSAATPTPI
jgi:hypothetical protein